jgi:DnaK suppressor protein
MAQIDLEAVRARLMTERQQLQSDIFDLTRGDRSVQPVDPLSDAGGLRSEQADDANMVFEAERNQGVVENAQRLLAQVDAALGRIENGTYGKCVRCGQEINPKRLEALPYATLCINCQAAVEAQRAR